MLVLSFVVAFKNLIRSSTPPHLTIPASTNLPNTLAGQSTKMTFYSCPNTNIQSQHAKLWNTKIEVRAGRDDTSTIVYTSNHELENGHQNNQFLLIFCFEVSIEMSIFKGHDIGKRDL